ncbi:DUF1330 domain-containing protein [Lysobacter yangpyeongensis]|jgi:uncharacterized protein (DUF1330 family)|uniref:DUF1330 domain-containing protein n=1 Tax=Lysobacter yangpyeongensis TaxID=346182 RepID=A0ABW0SQT5_9GAMM
MPALMLIELTVKDAEKLKEYSAQTPAILKKFNGELLIKGKATPVHASTPATNHDVVVIFQFPTREDALGWYQSPEYQQLLGVRDAAMDSVFKLVA